MPAHLYSGESGPRRGERTPDARHLRARVAGDELTVKRLRGAYHRALRQQVIVDRISRLGVSAGEAKYDAPSCQSLLSAAVEALCEGLGADSAYMLELVAEDVAFRVSAYTGQAIDPPVSHDAEPGAHLAAHAQTAAGWALRSNQVIRVEDYAQQDRFQRENWPGQQRVRSAVSMRVQSQKEPFGVLVAQSETPGQFSPTDAFFVCTIANLVSYGLAGARAALHQRRMYEEFRRTRSAREEALSIISHDLRSPATTVKLSLEILRRALRAAPPGLPMEQIERAIAKSQAGINRMMAMMDELLAVN